VDAECPDGARLFSVSNDKDGLCMDLPSNGPQASGTAVTEFTCNATTTDNQLWYLDAADNTHYLLRNLASDAMCLGVKGGISGASDALLLIEPCQSTADEWAMATG
jgi:hypothetical protein